MDTKQGTRTKDIKSKYKWWKDKKITGIFILLIFTTLFIFSFLKVPVLTSLHKYTFDMLIGWYYPFIYVYIIYIGLIFIFDSKVTLPKWLKITKISYWFVVISIVFISTQTGYFQSKGKWTEIGFKSWHAMSDWWDKFTSSNNAWVPSSTNGGIIGAFLYSFFAMIASGIGSLIISIILLILSVSILISGTSIGLYKQFINKKRISLERKEIKNDDNADMSKITPEYLKEKNNKPSEKNHINTPLVNNKKENIKQESEDDFPFDDPYK